MKSNNLRWNREALLVANKKLRLEINIEKTKYVNVRDVWIECRTKSQHKNAQ